jgi:prepilin-type N-terminal cleavage/methylation domain-containing protein
MSGSRTRFAGFTLLEMLIVVAVIGLLLALAVPNFLRMRGNAQAKACISNLGEIESAKQIWGLEAGKIDGDVAATSDLVPTYLKVLPVCPSGGSYDYHPIGEIPTCTIAGHTL